ncbi:glycosyltransferase [Loktanella sp. DJP18]|uniref:glycosyltransferase n=1 Tax=Loktanella sp. DJP18 TaxID=3409788 RepID=UPI003BB5E958
MSPIITVAISTLGPRFDSIDLPAQRQEISYLILVQKPDEVEHRGRFSNRSDVRVVDLDSIGLSRSRNAALEHSQTDLIMVADDDLKLDCDGILQACDFLSCNDDVAAITGMLKVESGGLRIQYASSSYELNRTNCGRVMSAEIILRRGPLKQSNIVFDDRFGLGTECPSGEEYILLCDILKAGLKAAFIPIVLAVHPDESTGTNWDDVRLVKARAKVISRVFGRMGLVYRILYLIKHIRRIGYGKNAFRFLTA